MTQTRRALPVPFAAVLLALVAAPWLADGYTLYTASRLMAVGLLAVSVAVLAGHSGLPTLGQTAPYAVGAYTTGLLAAAGHTVGPVLLVVSAATAAVFSLLVGVVAVRVRGVVFLMVTLAIGELTAIAAGQLKQVTGGTDGLVGVPAIQPFWLAPPLVDRHLYWYILAVATITLTATGLVLRSDAGMLLRACRDSEIRMRASGHPVNALLLLAYVGAGAVAGIAGSLLVTTQRYVSPSDVGFHVAALVLLAVIVGGAASLTSALLAVAVVILVRDWAAATVPGHGPLLLGLLFIAAVYLLPDGAAGRLADLTRWLQGRRTTRQTTGTVRR